VTKLLLIVAAFGALANGLAAFSQSQPPLLIDDGRSLDAAN
jgi:hypothetical protein